MSRFLFNFKKEFVPHILSGAKRQTLRLNRTDGRRPSPGDIACLYTGLRTRQTRLLLEATVTRCRSVRIDLHEGRLIVDGAMLTHDETVAFALADGFSTALAFFEWFRSQYSGGVLDGFLTEWATQPEGGQ